MGSDLSGQKGDLFAAERTVSLQLEPELQLVQAWTLDPAAPSLEDEARCQAERLRHASEEVEALAFVETAAQWPDP